ncbi:MAG: T9SS type A sorting domain-containing protein [Saprospiraceae bacterium]|nr:T9SS type A sorting domain-containing protein [Saprospiraceae bacterium]
MALPTNTLASVVIREFDVFGGYSPTPPLLTPINQEGNCTLIYTTSNPDEFTPASPAQPTNLAPDISLPITIKEFSVSKLNENSAILDWTSSSEINSSHFEIERSLDVENFEFVGSVQAAGNSSVELKYEFIDKKIPSLRSGSNVYYRLKMFDLDGTFEYSDIRGVNFGNDQSVGVSMYPNPTSQFLNLYISKGSSEEKGELQVFDALGKLILSKKVIGSGIETIDMGRMSNGVYHVVLTQGDQIFKEKIIKID